MEHYNFPPSHHLAGHENGPPQPSCKPQRPKTCHSDPQDRWKQYSIDSEPFRAISKLSIMTSSRPHDAITGRGQDRKWPATTSQHLQPSRSTTSRHKPTSKRRSHGPPHSALIPSTPSDTIQPATRTAHHSPAASPSDPKLVTVTHKTDENNIQSTPNPFEQPQNFRPWRHHDPMTPPPGAVRTENDPQWSANTSNHHAQPFPGTNQPQNGVLTDPPTLLSSSPPPQTLSSRPRERPTTAQLQVPATQNPSQRPTRPTQTTFNRFRPFSSNSKILDYDGITTPRRHHRARSGLEMTSNDQPTPPTIMFNHLQA